MNKFYILCGYPFSGKSTVAKALEKKFGFERVEMKKMYKNKEIDWEKTYDTYISQIKQHLKQKETVVVDTVGFNKKGRDDLRQLANEYGAIPYVVYLNTPLDVVKERWVQNRQSLERHDVNEDEFDSIVSGFEIPTQEEKVIAITPDMQIEDVYKLFT